MDWMVVNSMQVHSLFASLGAQVGDEYQISDECIDTLDEILVKLSVEDRTCRTFRRSLGFTQVIKKDLLPLIISVYDPKVIEATLKILVNLTIPVECLLSVDVMSKTDAGCQVIFELNQLLTLAKDAFVDSRSTRAIMDYIRRILDKDEKLSKDDCENVNNCLLLLRNILHIPEARVVGSVVSIHCSKQNQILWNLFTQSMDKVLIQLMTSIHKAYWGVAMVQLIALMYKDQHVGTLQKLLNIWFEASLSESSEDNESNTSPPDQESGDSSPMLMSDPTSDSSDNCSSLKDILHHHGNKMDVECKTPPSDNMMGKQHHSWNDTLAECNKTNTKGANMLQRKVQASCNMSRTKSSTKKQNDTDEIHSPSTSSSHCSHNYRSWSSDMNNSQKREFPSSSDMSDCGYATQMENPESISTSSNDDESPHASNRYEKPVHQKPHGMQKTRYSSKPSMQDKKDLRRKKLVKRSKNSRMNMKALLHHTPTDEDISNLLKEFTVDFLLKGYSALVQELHHQLLSCNRSMQIDTSHFFWLVIYFLKFAAQLELELEHIKPVLSFEIVSYLTYEGVNLCEQLELAMKQTGSDLRPYLRRMHLVVTAIREFIQTVDTYKKITHLSKEDRDYLIQLHLQIGTTDDLKCLFVLLLRHYNPAHQSKQYLQDLIVTNHILLLFLDKVVNLPEYEDNLDLMDHIKQFATVDVMRQYGLLLEDFENNGEFVNDCIFTMMHHIGGDLEKTAVLFQPSILKAFSHIWEADFEICDDWSDLIEYIIHKFMNTPKVSNISSESLQEAPLAILAVASEKPESEFSKEEMDSLYWYYVQSAKCADVVGKIMELYNENGVKHLTCLGIIQELFKQDIINRRTYDTFLQIEAAKSRSPKENESTEDTATKQVNGTTGETRKLIKSTDKIEILREHLIKEGKENFLVWLQKLLLQACSVKLMCEKQMASHNWTTLEPVPYHFTLLKQSIPVVPWNSEQSMILCHQPFILLLHKLGFHLPADSGKTFVRIPDFWTVDFLYTTAKKLGPIDPAIVKFDASILNNKDEIETSPGTSTSLSKQITNCIFGVPRPKQTSSMIRFTPLPQSTPNWMDLVSRSKCITSLQPSSFMTSVESDDKAAAQNEVVPEDLPVHVEKDECEIEEPVTLGVMPLDTSDQHSICSAETIADSVSSDLTRMCVSDGEEKPDDIDEECPNDNKHMDTS